jgi:hypothetical protein
LREWLVFQLQGSTDDDAPAAFFRIPSARSEKIEFTEWALSRRSLRRPRRSALGRECSSDATPFGLIKDPLCLLGPWQCRTIAEVDFGYGDGVTLVNQPLKDLRR